MMEIDETAAIGEASEAAEGWLELRDAGDTRGTWERSSSLFRQLVTPEQWGEAIGKVDATFGRPVSRELNDTEYRDSVPGAPDGHYVILTYDAAFERKKEAVETVVAMLEDGGEWRVGGYFVK
jgi:predicted RNase H-like HicB family nuclease